MKLILLLMLVAASPFSDWKQKKEKGFTVHYQSADEQNIKEYDALIKTGMKQVKKFFGTNFKTSFAVYVHPHRKSLDSTWQHDWKMPDFKSECWMVASGIADRLDMISPAQWKTQSCEHDYANREETQRLISHELVHVFHAQFNPSKDFSETENLDWFVEGLAAYASGQLTEQKLAGVKQAIKDNKIPSSLNDFWKGNLRYQLSGSVIMYIDKSYGRKKLKSLLSFTKKTEVLSQLNISEQQLLSAWKEFLLK